MKNRKLLLIVSLVLALTMSLGGTLAYLQDYDADVNTMVLGNVTITQNEQEWNADKTELVSFTQDKPMLPVVGDAAYNEYGDNPEIRRLTMANVVDKYVSVTNTGKSDAYVRTLIALEMGDCDAARLASILSASNNKADGQEFDFPGTWLWPIDDVFTIDGQQYNVMVAVHENPVKPGETTIPSLLQVYLKSNANNQDLIDLDGNKNGKYDVLVLSQAVQADGFNAVEGKTAAENALDTAFGVVDATNVADWFKGWADWSAESGEIGTPGIKWPTNNPPEFDGEAVENKEDLRAQLKAQLDAGETEIVLNANGAEIDAYKCLNKALVPAGTTLTIKGANFTGSGYGNAVAGTVIFENCKFRNPAGAYSIHFDAGNGEVIFNDCILEGWCSFGTAIKSVVMNNCQLKGNGIYAMYRFYQPTTLNNCVIDCSDAPANDGRAHGLSAVSGAKVTVNNCTLKYLDFEAENAKIIIDGDVVVESTGEYVFIPNSER